jgi:hypothetical protein
VASECILKLAVLKMTGTQCGVGSLGERKVDGRHFASSSSERGRASDGGAAWCPEEGENPEWAAMG